VGNSSPFYLLDCKGSTIALKIKCLGKILSNGKTPKSLKGGFFNPNVKN
jgi:hypothetical protein